MQKAKEYFKKAVESEKTAAVLWGSELDIGNDPPRKMAFLLLKVRPQSCLNATERRRRQGARSAKRSVVIL
jgi:hypothetical protein